MLRWLFGKEDASVSNDPYDILRRPAGPACRRAEKLLSSGRHLSIGLIDRGAHEKEEQAQRFFTAIEAGVAGRAFYSGGEMYHGPDGFTATYVYATTPEMFRDAQHWLLGPGGSLLPRHDHHEGGYSSIEMHRMLTSDNLVFTDNTSNDLVARKWAVAAGKRVVVTVLAPAGLTVRLKPDHNSPVQIVAAGTSVRFVDFSGDWALVSSKGEELGWTLDSLLGV